MSCHLFFNKSNAPLKKKIGTVEFFTTNMRGLRYINGVKNNLVAHNIIPMFPYQPQFFFWEIHINHIVTPNNCSVDVNFIQVSNESFEYSSRSEQSKFYSKDQHSCFMKILLGVWTFQRRGIFELNSYFSRSILNDTVDSITHTNIIFLHILIQFVYLQFFVRNFFKNLIF